jgi:putative two-component system response regulator
VGKIAIPDKILHKPGDLDAGEMEVMRRHAEMGYKLLTGSDSHLMELAATIAWTHHERFDGRGYPRSLAGDQIPIEGRIAAVADVFDALTSHRVYKEAFTLEKALAILEEERGKQFDPPLVDALLLNLETVEQIMIRYADH